METNTRIKPILRILPLVIAFVTQITHILIRAVNMYGFDLHTIAQNVESYWSADTIMLFTFLMMLPTIWWIASGKKRSKSFLNLLGYACVFLAFLAIAGSILLTNTSAQIEMSGVVPSWYLLAVILLMTIPGTGTILYASMGIASLAVLSGIALLNMLLIAFLSLRNAKNIDSSETANTIPQPVAPLS